MKQASIDLGTNTCLLLIKEGDTIVHDESNVVRLGQGVDSSGKLNSEAMARALSCLKKYAEIAKNNNVNPNTIKAVGTAQARNASNAKEFFTEVEQSTGIRFTILSGDEEAHATFVGAALPGLDPKKMAVMDIGGGSTELVSFAGGKSLNIGAVKMTERFLKSDPVTDEEYWNCENAINNALAEMKEWRSTLPSDIQFVAVAGTAVTLGMLQLGLTDYDARKIDGTVITSGDAHRLVQELKLRSIEERKKMVGMEVKRADVILAGAMIFRRVMEELNFTSAIVSTRGLRFGVLKVAEFP